MHWLFLVPISVLRRVKEERRNRSRGDGLRGNQLRRKAERASLMVQKFGFPFRVLIEVREGHAKAFSSTLEREMGM